MTHKKWKAAIVVQRYGEEVTGGAELEARWLAEHLLPFADVTAITTCALDYTTWADHYPAGEGLLNGVHLRRFSVDSPRNWQKSNRETGRLLITDHTLFAEYEWLKEQGPYSTSLLDYLSTCYHEFDFFIFFTYVYATTFFGLPLVADKAILVPTAHDEPFLTMPVFRPIFHLPRAIVYNTQAEQDLVNRVMGNERVPAIVAGFGVKMPAETNPHHFRQKYNIQGDFLLNVGRQSEAKNIPELIEFFLNFRANHPRPLKLVLAGRATIPLPDHPDIIATGFISEQEKFDTLSAATIAVIPSKYESLSILALEAWLTQTPILVNGDCDVLRKQCQLSNGGLYYSSQVEFEATLQTLLNDPSLRHQLGKQGYDFAQQRYDWRTIQAKYQALFATLFPTD